MDSTLINQAIDHALSQIKHAEVLHKPFSHILIDSFFPKDFYDALLAYFPDKKAFRKVRYPGAGYGKSRGMKNYYEYGFACNDLTQHYLFSDISNLFKSEKFSRALLDKFGQPLADGSTSIPEEKHQFFQNGTTNYTSVFDMQIDLPGYELSPHIDTPQKIITYQLFLTHDDSLRDYGTAFCRPKNGALTIARPIWLETLGEFIENTAKKYDLETGRLYRKLELSNLGRWLGIKNPQWLPWELFEVVKIASALPNHFMAFAPNHHSYHGVRMDVPDYAQQERRVIRGFLRAGADQSNWIYEYGKKSRTSKQ